MELLFNYITLSVAFIIFIVFIAILLKYKKSLSPLRKVIIFIVLGVLAVYFAFIIVVSVGFGSQPPREPTPTMSVSARVLEI